MSTNLQLNQTLNEIAQLVMDEMGNDSPLILSSEAVGIGAFTPLSKLHVIATGGFGPEDENGLSLDGNVPIVAQSNSTAIGILNADGRQAFALNIGGNRGVADARGVPMFYDKYDGAWHRSIVLRNGNVGLGTTKPKRLLHLENGEIAFTQPNNAANERRLDFMRTNTGDDSFGYKFSWRNDDNSHRRSVLELDRNGNVYFRGGRVGIGTATPQANLQIESARGDAVQRIRAGSNNTASLQLVEDNSPSGVSLDYHGDTNRLDVNGLVRGNQTQIATFTRGGRVGIGTVAPREELEVEGNILATGDVKLGGADCAEDFAVDETQELEPGTVMVIGDEEKLYHCSKAYDKKVAGVLSGAGAYKPGIILGQDQELEKGMPLALTGKVYCKVDARQAPIEIGDLLTTSDTPGHAMKVADPFKAFGAVIGKALKPLTEGQGLIPILIALQ